MRRRIIIILGILCLTIFAAVLATHYDVMARDAAAIGQCMSDCASEQGICIGQCEGNGNCISNCNAAHGRCVARCY